MAVMYTSDRPKEEQHNGTLAWRELEKVLDAVDLDRKPGMFLGLKDALGFVGAVFGAWVLFGLAAWGIWCLVEAF
ncbi:MAG: hypothetical protein JSV86_12900 [Gemmatimonadota bacterium]|nr:MAG: hypothetical protein JSV86_12900 [Gemmatimonadota bacterium]